MYKYTVTSQQEGLGLQFCLSLSVWSLNVHSMSAGFISIPYVYGALVESLCQMNSMSCKAGLSELICVNSRHSSLLIPLKNDLATLHPPIYNKHIFYAVVLQCEEETTISDIHVERTGWLEIRLGLIKNDIRFCAKLVGLKKKSKTNYQRSIK